MRIFNLPVSNNRIYGLDILRALAILFVVYGHSIPFVIKVWPKKWLTIPVLDGVSIFFVLSGFLIGGILIKSFEKKKPTFSMLWNFWIRRWFRTLPNYFLVFGLLFIAQGLILNKTNFNEAWWYLFFAQNLYYSHTHFFPEAWSLSVEEWFYILIPFSLFFLRKLKLNVKRSTLVLIVALLLFSILFRYYKLYEMDQVGFKQWDNLFRKQVFTRLDSIMFGVLGAWFSFYFKDLWLRSRKFLFVLGILLLVVHKAMIYFRLDLGLGYNAYYCVWSFSLISVATLFCIPVVSEYKKGSGRLFRVLTRISLISYSMYLVNLTLVQELILRAMYKIWPVELFAEMPLIYFGLCWFFTISISVLLYKYFEVPTTKLREKWASKNSE